MTLMQQMARIYRQMGIPWVCVECKVPITDERCMCLCCVVLLEIELKYRAKRISRGER